MSTMVISSSQNCVKCVEFHDEYEKYLQFTQHVIKSYIIDCKEVWKKTHEREHFQICNPDNISKLPQIKFYIPPKKIHNPYDEKSKNIMPIEVPYEGEQMNAESVVGTARYLMPDFSTNITSIEQYENFIEDTSIPLKVFYFTDNPELTHDWKGLSSEFRLRADIGIISENCTELTEKFEVFNFPTLILQQWQEEKQEYKKIPYKGAKRFESLRAFLNRYALKQKKRMFQSQFEEKLDDKVQQINSLLEIKNNILIKKQQWSVLHIKEVGQKNHPLFENIKDSYKKFFQYYEFRCEDEFVREDALKELNISSLPALIVYPFKNHKSNTLKGFVQVSKSDSVNSLATHLIDEIEITEQIMDDRVIPKFVENTYEKQKYPVIWFYDTDKDNSDFFNIQIHTLSNQEKFQKYLNFGRYLQPDENTFKLWEIDSIPAIIGLGAQLQSKGKQQAGLNRLEFDKEFEYDNLYEYLSQLALLKETEIIDNQKVEETNTMENFEKYCLDSGSKICMVAVLNTQKRAQFNLDLDNFNKFRAHQKNSGVNWVWVDGTCHTEVVSQLGLNQSDLPIFIYYDANKHKYKPFNEESFTLQNMLVFAEKIKKKKKGLQFLADGGNLELDERVCKKLVDSNNNNSKKKRKNKTDL